MTARITLDYRLSTEFRLLEKSYGMLASSFLWMELWTALGHHALAHRKSGFLSSAAFDAFVSFLPQGEFSDARNALLNCGLLQPVEGGYECGMFKTLNRELHYDYTPPGSVGEYIRQFCKEFKAAGERAQKRMAMMPAKFYIAADGRKIQTHEFAQALKLIESMDTMTHRRHRCLRDTPHGLILKAHDVVRSHAHHEQLEGKLKTLRIAFATLVPGETGMPPTTEYFLQNFDAIFELFRERPQFSVPTDPLM